MAARRESIMSDCNAPAPVLPAEVERTLRERCRQLRGQIQAADQLSEPCPPGRWRWADVKLGGYGRKPKDELEADQLRNQQLAVTLRRALNEVEAYLRQAGAMS